MLKKLTLAAGFGAGYVLGAKAGTQRYEEIVAKAREIAGMPAVQNATSTVQDTAGSLASSAKESVNDKVTQVSDKTSSSKGDQDVTTATGTGTGTGAGTRSPAAGTRPPSPGTRPPATGTRAPGGTGPRAAGAAPSGTAPVTPRP